MSESVGLSAGVIAAIAIAVVFLVAVVCVASICFVYRRRRKSLSSYTQLRDESSTCNASTDDEDDSPIRLD